MLRCLNQLGSKQYVESCFRAQVELAPWPAPTFGLNLPPEQQGCVGPLLALVDFVNTYGDALSLTPFGVEDLRGALLHRGSTLLLCELHLALLRLVLQPEPAQTQSMGGGDEPSRPKTPLVRLFRPPPEDAASLPCAAPPTAGLLTEGTWPELVRWVLLWRPEGVGSGDEEVTAAIRALATGEWWGLPVQHKVAALRALMECALASEAMRERLQASLYRRQEVCSAGIPARGWRSPSRSSRLREGVRLASEGRRTSAT